MPLQLGIWFIELFTFFIVFAFTFNAIFLLFNEYVDKYYIGVLFGLYVILFVAFGLIFYYGEDRTKTGRGALKVAMLLVLGALVLIYAWTIYYYSSCYNSKYVYNGMGDKSDEENYQKSSKQMYIVEQILVGIALVGLYIYFWFACDTWQEIADEE